MRKIDLKKEKEFENSKVLDSDVRIHQSKYYVAVSESLKKHKELTLKKINENPNAALYDSIRTKPLEKSF